MDVAMRLSEAVIGSVIVVAAFVVGVLSTAVVYGCIVILRTSRRWRSKQCYSDPLHLMPSLPPCLQQQQVKGEVDYEDVSVVYGG